MALKNLDLDSLEKKETQYIVYKKVKYPIIPLLELPFSKTSLARKLYDEYVKQYAKYEDMQVTKELISLHVKDFPVDDIENMSTEQVTKILDYIMSVTQEEDSSEDKIDPKS